MSRSSRSGGNNVKAMAEEWEKTEWERTGASRSGSGLDYRFPLDKAPRSIYQDSRPVPIQQQPHLTSQVNWSAAGNRQRRLEESQSGPRRLGEPRNNPPIEDSFQFPSAAYWSNQSPMRPPPQYTRPALDNSSSSNSGMPTIPRSQSMPVANHPPPVDLPPLPPVPQHQSQQKRAPLGSRRGIASYNYHPQGSNAVSPIPEESDHRHSSLASSHVIPSSSSYGPGEFVLPTQNDDNSSSEDENDDGLSDNLSQGIEHGLVRQASLGRKSKPTITEIRSHSRQGTRPANFLLSSSSDGNGETPDHSSSAERSLPPLPLPSAIASPSASRNTSGTSSPLTEFPVAETNELPTSSTRPNGKSVDSSKVSPASPFPPTSGRMKGRNPPSRLNITAIREAEARGSLTSLPDLIRRATKLAAALEHGRPESRWAMRNSMAGSSLNSNRRADSISDIISSFPPPILASKEVMPDPRHLSKWPSPSDFQEIDGGSSRNSPRRKERKICGLPLWAFILLVILAMLVIAAAVIVPLQLVTLSRNQRRSTQPTGDTTNVQNCKETNPCQNGGENVVVNNLCGCICTNGFGGSSCSQPDDSFCVTIDLQLQSDRNQFNVIRNATVGNAVKRLLEISKSQFNIELEASKLLSTFSLENVSCTAQDLLVTFNGEAAPQTSAKSMMVPTSTNLQKRETLVYDTSSPPPIPSIASTFNSKAGASATSTPTTTPVPTSAGHTHSVQLDKPVIDFARVAVLWFTESSGYQFARKVHGILQDTFKSQNGTVPCQVDVGNGFVVDFNLLMIEGLGNTQIGGATSTSTGRA